MQPWTNSKVWKPATVVKHHHTPRSYVVQAEDRRKYRRNRQHLRVCPAQGHDSLNGELPLGLDKTAAQDKEPAKDAESDQPRLSLCCLKSHPRSNPYTGNQQWRTLRNHMSPEVADK